MLKNAKSVQGRTIMGGRRKFEEVYTKLRTILEVDDSGDPDLIDIVAASCDIVIACHMISRFSARMIGDAAGQTIINHY